MKVKILIEFEVEPIEDPDGEFSQDEAKAAASQAAYDHLALTNTGQDVPESVEVHVDGFGKCQVTVGEDHQ